MEERLFRFDGLYSINSLAGLRREAFVKEGAVILCDGLARCASSAMCAVAEIHSGFQENNMTRSCTPGRQVRSVR
jgi:hypothetical protein